MAKVSSYLLFMRPDRNTKIQGVDQVMSQFGLTARRRPDYFEIDSTDARALEQWANTVGAPTSPKNVQVSLNQVNGWEMLNVLDFKTGIPEIKLIDEIHPIQPEEWLAWQSPEGKIQRNQDEVLADISRRVPTSRAENQGSDLLKGSRPICSEYRMALFARIIPMDLK